MYGNTLTRSLRGFAHMAKSPGDAARWVRNRIDKKSPLEMRLPWISWPCIRELRRTVKPGMRIFEWGGGGSSVFFLGLGAEVTTMESAPQWRDAVEKSVREAIPEGVDRHTLMYAYAEEGDPDQVNAFYEGVREGAPWDLILVDGLQNEHCSRMPCLERAKELVKPGGRVLLDDAWRDLYADAPKVMSGFTRREFKGLGPARPGVTRTDIYTHPGA